MAPVDSSDRHGDDKATGQQQQQELMSSFFPSPPSYYKHFTPENIALAKRFVARLHSSKRKDEPILAASEDRDGGQEQQDWVKVQEGILREMGESPDRIDSLRDVDLQLLVEAPDITEIEREGHWLSFGQVWPVREELPSLLDMGVKQLYSLSEDNFQARRQALHTLLHTILLTYLRLLGVLIDGPPSLAAEQARMTGSAPDSSFLGTQADSLIDHIRVAAINIHHLCNEWRPIQARETLKLLMRAQIEERKARTRDMSAACAKAKRQLDSLRTFAASSTKDAGLGAGLQKLAVAGDSDNNAMLLDDAQHTLPKQQTKAESARSRMQKALEAI